MTITDRPSTDHRTATPVIEQTELAGFPAIAAHPPPGATGRAQTARHYRAELRVLPGHAQWLLAEPGYAEIVAEIVSWLEEVR